VLRRLRASDTAEYISLREEALASAPFAFEASPGADFASDPVTLAEHLSGVSERAIFGVLEPDLVGIAGVFRDRPVKTSHKAHVWGMYVRHASRRHGHARALLAATIDYAKSLPGVSWLHVCVTSAAPEAKSLYESSGFVSWGVEPDALCHHGEFVTYFHLAMRLARSAA
jgi:GNAT superfamily N-acetyltransferase